MEITWIKALSEFINTVGFPVGLVCFGCYCILRAGLALWPKISTWLDAVAEKNRKLGENYEKGAQIMQSMANECIKIQNASLTLQQSNAQVLKQLASSRDKR